MVSVGGDRGARWALMGGGELRWQVLVALGEPGVGVTTGCMVLPAHYITLLVGWKTGKLETAEAWRGGHGESQG